MSTPARTPASTAARTAAHTPAQARVRAPELTGRGWLNTGGEALSLAGLRGRFVLLDFWTSCCVNCLHVLDELRDLEHDLADVLVTVGVHSPKFEHEADPEVLRAAVERYDVRHPVLDDPDLATWKAYTARAWPTLVLVDPEGYVVAHLSGEGHAEGLRSLLADLVPVHEARGTLHRGDGPYVAPPPPETRLRFPGGLLALPGGTFLVADTAHHQLVEVEADLETEVRRIGSGERGLVDGGQAAAGFAEPCGLALLPRDVAERVGWDVAVADTVNHAVRGVRLADGHVVTVAGTGEQLRRREGGGPALSQALSTPWDVAWWDGRLVVAMAGTHQLWALDPAPDPAGGVVQVLGGTTAEGINDGSLEQAWFAQPSGLVTGADGELWLADAETSAVRRLVRRDGAEQPHGAPEVADPGMANAAPLGERSAYDVETLVGTGLFDFGHRDGPLEQALLQHPLAVAVLPDGSVAVADTYNGAVRRVDHVQGRVTTLAAGLSEPSALVVEDTADGPVLVVAESSAHRLVRVPVPADARTVDAGARRTQRPPTDLAPGPLALTVAFTPPTGQKLDDRWGDPTRLVVGASPEALLDDGAGAAAGLTRDVVLADPARSGVTEGVLHVSVQAAACDGEDLENAACHLYQQDWGIPVRLVDGAGSTLRLDLRGV